MSRNAQALRRLKVEPEDVEQCASISEILRTTLGSTKKAIEALRFSNEPCAVSFLEKYDSLPVGDRPYLSMEAIAISAKVSTSELLGATLLAWKLVCGQKSALLAINAHPEIIRSTVRFAKRFDGDRDRKMLHEAVGFLPSPRVGGGGGNISVNLLNNIPQLGRPRQPDEEPPEVDIPMLFPPVQNKLDKWNDDRRKLLSSGK